jgi:hypothetical protein
MSIENICNITAQVAAATGGAAAAAPNLAASAAAAPAPPPAPAPAAAAAPQVAAPAAPANPGTVTIPLDQLQAFTAMQARLAKVEEDQQRRDAEARAEQIKVLAAKGQVEEALRQQREQSQRDLDAERAARAQSEDRAKRYALDGELARVLGSKPLVEGGAEQLTQLWRDQFIVEPQGNTFNVRTQDFKSVGDHIAAMLAQPKYSHFLRAQNGGGTAGGTGVQSAQTAPGQTAAPTEPKNLSEAVLMQMAARQQGPDPRLNPTVAFGLGRLPAKTG